MTFLRAHPVIFGVYLVIVSVCVGILVTSSSDSSPDDIPDGRGHTLELFVTSTGEELAAVSFVTPGSDPITISQYTHVRLPWRKVFRGVPHPRVGFNLHAVQSGSGRLSCVIKLDGEIVAEAASRQDPALISCSPR